MITADFVLQHQGAEARIYFGEIWGKPAVLKKRFVREYRHEFLDQKLACRRLAAESEALLKCSSIGLQCPVLYFVDFEMRLIVMEKIKNSLSVGSYIDEFLNEMNGEIERLDNLAVKIGKVVSTLHKNGLVHGNLTASNMLVKSDQKHEIVAGKDFDLYVIDFELSFTSTCPEDKCIDLSNIERAFFSTNPKSIELFQLLLKIYFDNVGIHSSEIRQKFSRIKKRGRRC